MMIELPDIEKMRAEYKALPEVDIDLTGLPELDLSGLPELDIDFTELDRALGLDVSKKPKLPQSEGKEMTKTKAQDVTIKETYDLPGTATVEIRVSADVTKYQAAKALMVWLIKYMEATESWKKRKR